MTGFTSFAVAVGAQARLLLKHSQSLINNAFKDSTPSTSSTPIDSGEIMPNASANDEFIDYYCNMPKAEFAILIIGPWGSGKTHFIKRYFKDQAQSTNTSGNNARHLYASLYGVRSVSEITDQFFSQAHPRLNHKAVRLFGGAASRFANFLLQGQLISASEDGPALKEFFFKLDGHVLVFDDLERCAMPLNDVLGFINAFVEHDGHKVIVIANEDEIPDDQKAAYQRIKEKLFGKTLQITSNASEVYDSLLDRVQDAAVQLTLTRERNSALRLFGASKMNNFRSLRFILSDYERLVTVVDDSLKQKPEAMSKLLLFMVAVGMEYRSGNLSSTEISSFSEIERAAFASLVSKGEKSLAVVKFENLEITYPDVDWTDAVIPLPALGMLFDTGIIDKALIDQHLSQHPLIVGYAETPAWRQLWSWFEMPREQYLKAREQLIAQLQTHELTHPGVILHAAGIVLSIKELDDNLLGSKDVAEFFSRYLQDLQAAGRLEPARDLFGRMAHSYANLGYQCESNPEFRRIKDAAEAATFKTFESSMLEVAKSYLDRILSGPDNYSSLHEYGVSSGNYADAPFLHYIDPKDFAEVVITNSMPNGRLLGSLHARYEHEMVQNAPLAAEYPWLKRLRSSLEDIAVTAQPPHKRLLETRIEYYFDKIDSAIPKAEASTLNR